MPSDHFQELAPADLARIKRQVRRALPGFGLRIGKRKAHILTVEILSGPLPVPPQPRRPMLWGDELYPLDSLPGFARVHQAIMSAIPAGPYRVETCIGSWRGDRLGYRMGGGAT